MSYIKRKRDQRDYELRRMFDQFARMPQRIQLGLPLIDNMPRWNPPPATDRIWVIPNQQTTEAAPSRAASYVPWGNQ